MKKAFVSLHALALLFAVDAFGDATVTNGILSVSPSVATQGASGLKVTFTLSSTNSPPVPGAGIPPSKATIGTNLGSSLVHTSQYLVTATFSIPAGAATGLYDVAVTFPHPIATNLIYNRLQAFQIVAGSGVAAGFSGSPKYGAPPLLVVFTNTSSGSITNQLWNFGDSSTSTNPNPTHAYTTAGVFTVSLTVFGAGGSNTLTRAAYITVTTNTGNYLIVDTGQTNCYSTNNVIAAPSPGQPFFGQDAQLFGNQPGYTLSGDGKTVFDRNTGLMWMRAPNTTLTPPVRTDKKTMSEGIAWVATVNAANYGGFSDWRMPTMKELYSLMNFKGTDPSSYNGSDLSVLTPFIDTNYFLFAYGQTNTGERVIDSQYASSDLFVVNPAETGSPKLFGLNLADGRIKGYDLTMPDNSEKTFFVQLVRGPADYGLNSFTNNGDGTITDRSTGLMWPQGDNGSPLLWSNALAWVQAANATNYLGHNDWRMPNAKELHSIVEYVNAPDFNGKPAIDTAFFACTVITNEAGRADFPYYWASTTHAGYSTTGGGGGEAVYIPFGRALGWPSGSTNWVDVHGAGCQRSDPKVAPPYSYATVYVVTNNGTAYTGYAWGPQGDAIRGLNFVRPVRGGNNSGVDHVGDGIPDWWRRQYFGGAGTTTNAASCSTSDADLDGMTVLQEYLADTNPTNGSSRLAIIGIASLTNSTQLVWIGGTGVTQVVEARRDLSGTNDSWTAVATNIPPTAITNMHFRSGETATNLFWRIRTWR